MGRVAYSGNYKKRETLKNHGLFKGFVGGNKQNNRGVYLDNSSSKEN